MPRLKSQPKPNARSADAYGAFMPDGSYYADATLVQRGPTDRFIRAMVKSRGTYGFDPATAAEAIQLAHQEAAFPNHRQWIGEWPFAWTSTSAEEAVKRCAIAVRGPDDEPRHWCGERWVSGDERRCDNPAHRERASNEFVRETLSRIAVDLPKGLGP